MFIYHPFYYYAEAAGVSLTFAGICSYSLTHTHKSIPTVARDQEANKRARLFKQTPR